MQRAVSGSDKARRDHARSINEMIERSTQNAGFVAASPACRILALIFKNATWPRCLSNPV